MTPPRVWLITGASSGFGRLLTEFALSQGDSVVATLRKPEVLQILSENYPEDRLLILKVDVTQLADIEYAFARSKEVFGRLDVVFNNAGYAVFGNTETTPDTIARSMFEVNFWGAIHMSQAAIRFFRDVNEPGRGGVLLQNSAIAGIQGHAGLGFYSASKHAFNGFSESLAKELLPQWNIKICIIGTGGFDTSVMSKAIFLPDNPIYSHGDSMPPISRSVLTAPGFRLQGDPTKFVRAIYSLVEGGKIPLHLPIGQEALGVAREKVASLGKYIAEAEPWSADLL